MNELTDLMFTRSGLARWWGGSGAQEETEAGPVDPEIQLTVQHSVKAQLRFERHPSVSMMNSKCTQFVKIRSHVSQI